MAGGGGASGRWLVTYADLITLLMVLFLMLFSSSQIQKEKLIAISDSLRRSLHKDAEMGSSAGAALLSVPQRERTLAASAEAFEEAVKALGLDKSISVSTDERGTVIAIVDAVFFDSGSAVIKPKTLPVLREVGLFCKETGSEIRVEGHTDNQPIENNPKMRSNWQLSALRATEVVEYFIQLGMNPRRVGAVAFADTRPLVPNTTEANRARNRRIEIVLLTTEVLRQESSKNSLTQLDLIERNYQQKEEAALQTQTVKDGKKE
jgi:chemotaxis protein MotB